MIAWGWPSAGKLPTEKACGLVNGALNDWDWPSTVTVSENCNPKVTSTPGGTGTENTVTFVGGLVTAILLAATSRPLDLRLTEFFEKASYPEAHGRNVVNVILVDFRAFDTFGEISVVTVAALAAVALLRQRRGGDRT